MTSPEGEQAPLGLQKRREADARAETKDPLRRRIMVALLEAPSTPSGELADAIGSPRESVSRTLKNLEKEELVIVEGDPGDKRKRRYSLSADGEARLRDMRAFGAPEEPPPPPDAEEIEEFLRSSLRSAVRLRRESNRLEDAIDRLRLVLEQAEKAAAHAVALDSMVELATTLRQHREFEEIPTLVERMRSISLGQTEVSADNVLPATAHLEYTLGRLTDHGESDLRQRAEHLVSAARLYGQLLEGSEKPASDWGVRQAWSIVSYAGNLRKRAELEDALRYSDLALDLYEGLEDDYGRSHCLFMFGFNLRLLGDFDEAWAFLNSSFEIAEENTFNRFAADSLLQMGEVRRCQGNVDDARIFLNDALGRTSGTDLRLTNAFAQSALGAVYFQEGELDEAGSTLEAAQKLFEDCKHGEGMALNAYRHAKVAHQAARTKSQLNTATQLIQFAEGRYRDLSRPAGIAACELETRQLEIKEGRISMPTVVSQLKECLWNRARRKDLERDSWVPQVLYNFAKEKAGDDELFQLTAELLSSAKEQLAEEASPVRDRVAQLTEQETSNAGDGADAAAAAAEMGGETRLRPDHEFDLAA
jgi:DNA-binding MarR family transcriptional regulator